MSDQFNTQFNTVDSVELWAAQNGLALSPADRRAIAAAQAAEIERFDSVSTGSGGDDAITRWNTFYPALLSAIVGVGNVIVVTTAQISVNLGKPLILVVLLWVEHHRVEGGIRLFDATYFASFAAWALVLLNLVTEFAIHYTEGTHGYERARRRRWSLRIWWANMSYRLGIGKNWTESEQSPAADFIVLARLTALAIITLALAGSMQDAIAAASGVWHKALIAIVTESTLSQIITWAGGLIFTLTAVTGVQLVSRYIAVKAAALLADRQVGAAADFAAADRTAAADRAGARVALAIISQKMDKRREKSAAAAGANPLDFPLASAAALQTGD